MIRAFACLAACAVEASACVTHRQPALSITDQANARDCRGWITERGPEHHLRTLRGRVFGRGEVLDPLPDVLIVVVAEAAPSKLYAVRTDKRGYFRLQLADGLYTLKTCYEGWDTVEVPIRISSRGDPDDLLLTIGLSA